MKAARPWVAILLLLGAAPAAGDEPPGVSVTLQGARLSVTGRAPLAEILVEIGRASGIPIHLDAAVKASLPLEPVAVAFDGVPIEEGLRRLLLEGNFVFVYSSTGLAEVRVYLKGSAAARPAEATRPPASRAARRAARPVANRSDDPSALARLRAVALGSPDPRERLTALDTLSASRDSKLAVETALQVLERERDEAVLEGVLDLLARQRPVPLGPVLRLATADLAPSLRIRALEVASAHGPRDPRVRALLQRLEASDPQEEVRESARELLKAPESGPGERGTRSKRRAP